VASFNSTFSYNPLLVLYIAYIFRGMPAFISGNMVIKEVRKNTQLLPSTQTHQKYSEIIVETGP